jgi:hypothetical protein
MQVHAQSTMTLAQARPPYVHLGYISASPAAPLRQLEMFVPGVVMFMIASLVAMKLNYGWLFGGLALLFKKVGFIKIIGGLLSILLVLALIFVYFFAWIFD